ncbi:MAG: hypothetical protein K9N49_10510, partial [Candidatus Marinimicrobia bacterium]|nr:hypothetical protein [Candidatus Neomarinimicrobiota bacterium]
MKSPRFLVLRGGALGDMIVTLPVFAAPRRHWPDAYLELVCYPRYGRLARLGGLIDGLSSLDEARIARFFAWQPAFDDAQRRHISSFDLVISFLHNTDGTVAENLRAAGAPQVISHSPLVTTRHAADHFLSALETLAIYESGQAPTLVVPPAWRARGQAALAALAPQGPALIIHPGSGSPAKNWPLAHFLTLYDLARAAQRQPIFLFGEADAACATAVAQARPDAPQIRDEPLEQVAALLAAGPTYVGNDSGISHLAAALG